MLRLPPTGLSSLYQILVVQCLRQQGLRRIAFFNVRTTHSGQIAHVLAPHRRHRWLVGNEGFLHVLHET